VSLLGLAIGGVAIGAIRLAWALRHRGTRAHILALGGEVIGDRYFVVRRGVSVELRVVRRSNLDGAHELSASVVVPSGLKLSCRRNWESRPLPPLDVWTLPIVRDGKVAVMRSSDPDAPGSIERFEDAVDRLAKVVHNFVIGIDDQRVLARIEAEMDREVIDIAVDAMVALARHDRGLTDTLLGLPEALAMTAHELDPGVQFAADGLVLGVREGVSSVAQLDGFPAKPARAEVRDGVVTGDELAGETAVLLAAAGDGDLHVTSKAARFTWTHVERDRDRLLAGVRALRSLRPAVGPYR
jgi:hypothetical protein